MKNDLNVAPTEKELDNAATGGHRSKDSIYYFNINSEYELQIDYKNKGMYIHVVSDTNSNPAKIESKFTKQNIENILNLFGKPSPQWEKVAPKFWEVWQFNEGVVLILNLENEPLSFVHLNEKAIGRDTKEEYFLKHAKKLADRLDDYCKEKYRTVEYQTCCEWSIKSDSLSCGTIKAEHVKPEILQKPYSYASLKAQGKIPHDRSGINHDKIEAFSKLLDIKEVLDKEFEADGKKWVVDCDGEDLSIDWWFIDDYTSASIYFNSKKAAHAALKDNKEIFEILLKK